MFLHDSSYANQRRSRPPARHPHRADGSCRIPATLGRRGYRSGSGLRPEKTGRRAGLLRSGVLVGTTRRRQRPGALPARLNGGAPSRPHFHPDGVMPLRHGASKVGLEV